MKSLNNVNPLDLFVSNANSLIDQGYYDRKINAEVPNFLQSIQKSRFSIVAELKIKSPTSGIEYFSRREANSRIQQMARYADALSILTEPNYFAGSIKFLELASKMNVPVLMKDFIVDERQLRVPPKGAGILLIMKILSDEVLHGLIEVAKKRGLVPIIEIDNQEDLLRINAMDDVIVGINNRNLETFEIRRGTAELLSETQKHRLTLGFSGYQNTIDIVHAASSRLSGVLIGTALSKDSNPGERLKLWKDNIIQFSRV